MFKRIKQWICGGALLMLPIASLALEPIVIGQAVDLSGQDGSLGRDYVAGIKTCFDMVNAAGGINGRRIRFIVRDDGGLPASTAAATEELIERERVDYLFGGIGSAAVQAATGTQAFRRSSHVLYAPLAAGELGQGKRVLYWRPGLRQEIAHIFSHFSKLGISKVGVVYQDKPDGLDAFRHVQAEAQQRKILLLQAARMTAGGGDLEQQARRMAEARPGFVLVLADGIGTALFLKAFRAHDRQTFIAGTSLTNLDTLLELAGKRASEWTVFSQVVPNPAAGKSPLQLEHLAMMRKYRDESVSSLTLEGFAAARTLLRIIQQSHRGGAALQDFVERRGSLDVGGMAINADGGNRLSDYLDIALLRKGGELMY